MAAQAIMRFNPVDPEAVWPNGYKETWEGYTEARGGYGSVKSEEAVVRFGLCPHYNDQHVVLEIGPGRGFWTTKYLLPNFKHVVALDVVPQHIPASERLTYVRAPIGNVDGYSLQDQSIDFCWSFGCFCHFDLEANAAYLRTIFRVLKPGSSAVVMFANSQRHRGWEFANDAETTKKMTEAAGFVGFQDLLPDFRDTLAVFKKPLI